MPPRYAYWTILVDDQPTAFRAALQEDLLPTFKRLKQKHPTAVMKWFQNGKLWESRIDAQEAMHARGERGRSADPRQSGFRNRDRSSGPQGPKTARPVGKPDWKPRGAFQKPEAEGRGPRRSAEREGGLEWKPKGEFTPAPPRSDRPEWKPKGPFQKAEAEGRGRPEWKPKGSFRKSEDEGRGPRRSAQRERGPEWKPKGTFQKSAAEGRGRPEWKPKGSVDRDRKPEWKPKPDTGTGEKRKWIPKTEYKKSQGIEAKRDKSWRPGGEHKDPRQKYKDAKKAKWSRFKTTIRSRWESKPGKKKS